MDNSELYLIDANAFCYRAFYALGNLSTSGGQPTGAIYGFTNILNKLLKQKKPQFLAACFDVSRETFRQKKFAEYKIQRAPMPDELSSQIPLIKEIISAYGITICEKEGFEADDIIATLSTQAKVKNMPVVVVSSDKDMLQLVGQGIKVLSLGKNEEILYDADKVKDRFGLGPQQVVELISLMGDDADNIPGAKGIGEKTAVELLKTYGSLDNILSNIDTIKPERAKKAVANSIENIKLSRELAILDHNVRLGVGPEDLRIKEPDYQKLVKLFKQFEFKSFLKELPVLEDNVPKELKAEGFKDSDLKDLLKKHDEISLSLETGSGMVINCAGKNFIVEHINAYLASVLADKAIKKTGHNLKKIKLKLAKDGFEFEGLYFDTMIAAYLLNPSKSSYALSDLAWDYLGNAPGELSGNNLKCTDLILRLKPKLEKDLEDKSLKKLFTEVEMPLVEVLSRMEITGIKIDVPFLKKLSGELDKKLDKLISGIYQLSGSEFNINSPKQLREILFDKLKLPVIKRTKTGPSTDEEVLNALAGSHKLPAMLLDYRQMVKLKFTYVDVLPELVDHKTERVHTSFNQAATETGRLSSSNPNLQNIPIKTELGSSIRKAIISFSKDSYLLSCDYSQMELRILAHVSKDKTLLEAFKNNKDIHRITAALIHGVKENEVEGPMREVAKRINFGIIYGLSAYGLSRDLKIRQEDAQGFIDAYFLRYPGVKEYIEKQIKKAEADGFVTTMFGRRRYLPEINSKNQAVRSFAQRQAVNTPLQGSASDLIKLAMVHIDKEISRNNLKGTMILQIHDELLFDVPVKGKHEFIAMVKDKMENVTKLDVPVKIDMKIGKNWLEMEEAK